MCGDVKGCMVPLVRNDAERVPGSSFSLATNERTALDA